MHHLIFQVLLLAIEELAFSLATWHSCPTCIPGDRLKHLTSDHAWCSPEWVFLFMPFATWNVHLLLLKVYVIPLLIPFHPSRILSALQKRQLKVLTEEANETSKHKPLALYAIQDSRAPRSKRELRRRPEPRRGKTAKSLPQQVSLPLLQK